MLVITRREGEQIHVGPDIVITVRKVSGKQCKLAVAAPDGVEIMRSELMPDTASDTPPSAARPCRDET